MSRFPIFLAILCVGCANRSYNVADPVVGPVPPRNERAVATAQLEETSAIEQVSFEKESGILPSTYVVARVNGRPILAGAILEPYASRLKQLSKQVPPDQFRQGQEMLIKRDLPSLIEQTLMVDAVTSKLEKKQLDEIQKQLDIFFDAEIERMKTQFEVDSVAELEGVLQENGMSLETMRHQFGDRQLAMEYVRGKLGDDAPLTRQELLAEYKSRLDEYKTPAQVKWQQLQVSISKQGNETKALAVMDRALAELKNGADFTEVVKRYSDGPLAANGGHWDWTQPTSIANPKLREALETLPENRLSEIMTSGDFLSLVKITGRRAETYTPFQEVQETLRTEVAERRRKEAGKQIVAELKESAIIETMFDEAPQGESTLIR